MNDSYLDNDIASLSIDDDIIKILRKNNINLIRNIWILKRKDLKRIGLLDHQINSIVIRLQLHGLDINGKVYNCYK